MRMGLRLMALLSLRAVALQPAFKRTIRRGMAMLPPHLEEAKRQIDAGEARLLDVREPAEWRAAHFKNATLLPLSELQRGNIPYDIMKEQGSTRFYLHVRMLFCAF